MKLIENSIILITGGTGSFGKAFLNKLLNSGIKEIRIFSRDEKKQDDMRKKYQDDKLKFIIGDIRDMDSCIAASRNVDYIFHAAALKQVPSCEFYPLEAVKTNVLGSENILNAAITNNVKKVVCLSTDKAVYPINAMGVSKAMMEKVVIAKARMNESSGTIICLTRYGNVMGSRGSVIPLFINQIRQNKPLTVTDPNMTRFLMTLEDAVDLVLFAFENGQNGDIYVQKSPASSIETLVEAVKSYLDVENHPVETIGTRHGEKLYETLLSREEFAVATDLDNFYKIPPDLRDLNYDKFYEYGREIKTIEDYNSSNTHQLNIEETIDLLKKIDISLSE
jgi:UDP-N-acetylglucosamine 4,6-dehydratase/5-epimerase